MGMVACSAKNPTPSDETVAAEGSGLDGASSAGRALAVESAARTYEDKLAAFLRIAEDRRGQLIWMAQRMTTNREDAEEIVQEAFLRAFKHLPKFRGESTMATWLCAIVQNVGLERIRNQKGLVYLPLEQAPNENDNRFAYDFPDPGRNPEQHCQNRELEEILLSEIDGMDSICKRTIQLCALEELSQIEVANALGVSVLTVKSRLFNGRRMLKRAVCLRVGIPNDSSQSLEATV
jgi:RNA polymerase sigma-70 factor, ECF subfamily